MKPKSSKRVNEQRQRQRWLLALRHNWWHQIHIQWDLTCPGQNGLACFVIGPSGMTLGWNHISSLVDRTAMKHFILIRLWSRIELKTLKSNRWSLLWFEKPRFSSSSLDFIFPTRLVQKKRLRRRKNWVSAFNWQTREREKNEPSNLIGPVSLRRRKKNLITFAFTRLKAFFILRKRNFNESLKCGLSAHSTPSAALMETRPASCFETRRDGLLIILNG